MGMLNGDQLQFFYALDQDNNYLQLGNLLMRVYSPMIMSNRGNSLQTSIHRMFVGMCCQDLATKARPQTLSHSVIEQSIEINSHEKNTFLPLLSFLLACASGEQKTFPKTHLIVIWPNLNPKTGAPFVVKNSKQ